MIEQAGEGVVVYLRQEGRGIGLINKLKAYSLQDIGLDTVEANERLGFPADLRNYGVGAQILSDLGVQRLRLITNNPRKIAGLGGYGIQVEDRVPLVIEPGLHNANYLQVKRTKLGHLLEKGPSCPVGGPLALLGWRGSSAPGSSEALSLELKQGSIDQPLALLQAMEAWGKSCDLAVERHEEPRQLALLNQPQLAIQLSGATLTKEALLAALEQLASWPGTSRVSLLLASDGQRSAHPSAALEPQRRPLIELGAKGSDISALRLDSELLIEWS
jgi:3,4-dihydroxy 2-butanone 4-phosphate synthase/GTP cyclohydrolase II